MSTTTKSAKYFDLINSTEAELERETNKLKAEGAHLALQSRMLDVKKSISQSQVNLQNSKSSTSYNPSGIYSYQNQIDLLERELKFYTELEKEQF